MPPQRRAPTTRKHQSVATQARKKVGNAPCTSFLSMKTQDSTITSAAFKRHDGEDVDLVAAAEEDRLLPPFMRKAELFKRFVDRRKSRRAAPNAVRDYRLPQQIGGAANAANAAPAQAFAGQAVENAQRVGIVPQPIWQYEPVQAPPQMPVANHYNVANQPRAASQIFPAWQ